MSLAAAALATIKAIQVPLTILGLLEQGLWPNKVTLTNNSEYDYVIVGGGTAGIVVATRLAQITNSSIIVLETGPDPPVSALLAGLFVLLPGSYVDCNYTSTFDNYAARSQNNYTQLTAGCLVGGSASINHLFSTRSSKHFHDTWAEKVKDRSWNYDSVLPYYKKSENVQDDEIIKAYRDYHGTNGPTVNTREVHAEANKYLDAFAEVGNPKVLDLNVNVSLGYTHPLYTIGKLLRQTPAVTYPPLVNKKLNISRNTKVTKILIENKTAVGVEAVYNSKTYTIKAKKEVIVCAGVFNSPQLLMLSGIGKAEHLKKFDIPVVADLPVGDNFQDQVSVSFVHTMETSIIPELSIPIPTQLPIPGILGAGALNKSQSDPDYITFGLIIPHDTPYVLLLCSVVFGYRDDICDRINSKITFRNTHYTLLSLSQPKSTGKVRLASADPFQKPLITTGYYKVDSDLDDMVNSILDFLQVQQSSYFRKVNAELVGLDLPECSSYTRGTREFWKCYVLSMSVSPYHYSGTCAMGSVVDSESKVYGVDHLRVADASVIPMVTTSAPAATVIMLAEKLAAMITNTSCSDKQTNQERTNQVKQQVIPKSNDSKNIWNIMGLFN